MILVISSKKVYAAQRLEQEAKILNYELRIMDVGDLLACNFKIDVTKFQCLYVRDPYLNGSPKYIPNIISLAKKFKRAGKRVVDSVIADGNLAQGKWADYQKLAAASLSIPKTNLLSGKAKRYPLVLKWIYGFKGANVFLVKNQEQLKKLLPLHPKKEWLTQEYVNADFEFEVYVVGFKSVSTVLAYKTKNGFKANVKKSAMIKNPAGLKRYNQLLKLAARAAKVLGRELCKVDILARGGEFFILEVNRNPGLVSFESLIRYNIASEFVNYLVKEKGQ